MKGEEFAKKVKKKGSNSSKEKLSTSGTLA